MILKTLAAAMTLLWVSYTLNFSSANTVEPTPVEAPAYAMQAQQKMGEQTLSILIEDHAAPNWNLSTSEAWYQYNIGAMVIVEIEEDKEYTIHYDGGYMEVLLDEI